MRRSRARLRGYSKSASQCVYPALLLQMQSPCAPHSFQLYGTVTRHTRSLVTRHICSVAYHAHALTFLAITNGSTASNLILSLSLSSITAAPALTAHTLKCPAVSIAADRRLPLTTAAARARVTTANERQRRRTFSTCQAGGVKRTPRL
jgi:hypothetical protein